jgi:hypothetical protein
LPFYYEPPQALSPKSHCAFRRSIGLLMFEFSRFWPAEYEHGRDFIADLERFLGQPAEGDL